MDATELLNALAKALTENIKIDYRKLREELDYGELAQHIVPELDYSDLSSELDYSELAHHVEARDVARELDLSDVLDYLSHKDLANEVDLGSLASHIDLHKLAILTNTEVENRLNDKLAELQAKVDLVDPQMIKDLHTAWNQEPDLRDEVNDKLADVEGKIHELLKPASVRTSTEVVGASVWQVADLRALVDLHETRIAQCELSTRALYEAFLRGYAKAMESRP